jgi:hypothetical protein
MPALCPPIFFCLLTCLYLPRCCMPVLSLSACLLNCPVCPHLGDELHVAEVEDGGEDAPDDVGGLVREAEPLDGLDDPRVVRPLAGGVRRLLVLAGQVSTQGEGGSYNLITRVVDPDPHGSVLN